MFASLGPVPVAELNGGLGPDRLARPNRDAHRNIRVERKGLPVLDSGSRVPDAPGELDLIAGVIEQPDGPRVRAETRHRLVEKRLHGALARDLTCERGGELVKPGREVPREWSCGSV